MHDTIMIGDDIKETEKLNQWLAKKFEIKGLGEVCLNVCLQFLKIVYCSEKQQKQGKHREYVWFPFSFLFFFFFFFCSEKHKKKH